MVQEEQGMMKELTQENVQVVCNGLRIMLNGWVFAWTDEVNGHRCSTTELRVIRPPSVVRHEENKVVQLLLACEPIIRGRPQNGLYAGVEIHSSYDNQDDAPHYQFRKLPDGLREFVVVHTVNNSNRVVYTLRQQFRLSRVELMKHVLIH